MVQPTILEKLEKLPESLQTEVLHYIEFLLEKYAKTSLPTEAAKKKRQAGLLKGKILMSDDFDAPLEDLKDYL
jgi:mRNA-degrading endonuclease RelE of RelBE toxin-antitoxin system